MNKYLLGVYQFVFTELVSLVIGILLMQLSIYTVFKDQGLAILPESFMLFFGFLVGSTILNLAYVGYRILKK